ncbi:hypothetical protein [Solicola sp. PLA-1-18]|uniref:hypothetical protein n=1 Tax=Solicola sp. PLA-1-18 TaxID=3380532 RepID=UPI003B7DC331
MSDDTSGEPTPQRRVVRRVVRKPVAAPPPVAAPAPASHRAADDDTAPLPVVEPVERDERRAPAPGRRAARAPRLSLPSVSVPKVSMPTLSLPSLPSWRRRQDPSSETREDDAATVVVDEPRAEPSSPVAVRVRERSDDVRRAVAVRLDRARALPMPALAAVLGLVLGLVAVLLCWAATEVFAALLGTPAGGRWGFLVLAIVGVATIVVGSRALRALDAPEPGATAFVGVVLVPVVVLGLFLGLSATGWAFVIVPLLSAATFALAHLAMARLSSAPTED